MSQLDRIERMLTDVLRYCAYLPLILKAEIHGESEMSELSDKIAALQTAVSAESDVITSAETLLAGLKTSLDDALAKLAAAGVAPADLQALSDLSAAVGAK